MRRSPPVLALAGCVLCVVTGCAAPSVTASPPRHRAPVSYYLALGDSLAQGVQPDSAGASVETRAGYPDQLQAMLRRRQPGLRLVRLGCPGETSATMLHGGLCSYPGGSQVAAAVRFLRRHPARVSLITIDIGANDLDSCITETPAAQLAVCVGKAIPRVAANLAKILARLRQADPHARIIAMNYYLPELAEWRQGPAGEALARLVLLAAAGYNKVLTSIYQASGVRVANVFGAFHTTDFGQYVSLPGLGRLPRNVATICQLTWECAAPPRGPNEHPNRAGYRVIARAFLLADPR
jgi:lysophospholipase L1-like esterase